jgi:hypothetical protein
MLSGIATGFVVVHLTTAEAGCTCFDETDADVSISCLWIAHASREHKSRGVPRAGLR